jgi:hypothetical protein
MPESGHAACKASHDRGALSPSRPERAAGRFSHEKRPGTAIGAEAFDVPNRTGNQRSRFASSFRRSAFSLMKPAASIWS